MTKRVLDVGNCVPDHTALTQFLTSQFGCEVLQADGGDDALALLAKGDVDLVLVNRKLDMDYSDGIEVIRRMKADAKAADVPVMLITNYPEHQDAAEVLGALRGFGKLEYQKPETLQRLESVLGRAADR